MPPGQAECPRCHEAFEVGVARACRSCGLALGADGGLPYALFSDSVWPDAKPPLNPKKVAKGLAAVSGIVGGLLVLCLGVLAGLAAGPDRDAAVERMIEQPEVIAALGQPVTLRFAIQASGPVTGGFREIRTRTFLLLLEGPRAHGLARVTLSSNGGSLRQVPAAFRTLSGSWEDLVPLPRLGMAPSSVLAALQSARAHLHQEEYAKALEILDAALVTTPRWTETWILRALALRGLGESPRALADVKRALLLGATEFEAVRLYIELLPEDAPPHLAVDAWNAFLAHTPDDANARVELGFAHMAAGSVLIARPTFTSFCTLGHTRACEGLAELDAGAAPPPEAGAQRAVTP